MLTRLYVDNFRALVNADLALDRRSLLMGSNGTGKSTFGDVLVRLQWMLLGQAKTDDAFTVDTLTRWQSAPQQRIEMDVTGPEGAYHYEMVIEHRQDASAGLPRTRIRREILTLDSRPLFHFENGIVRLYADDFSPGPEYPFEWGRSALGTIAPQNDNRKLTWFVRWLQTLAVLRPNPPAMQDLVEGDQFLLGADAANFAAWYHAISAADKRRDRTLHDTLVDVLPGFEALNFEPAGPNRWLLRADFRSNGQKLMLRFRELSDGQRALILLYSVLYFLLQEGRTVFLDEPDNFVALDEIQPWLFSATDLVDGGSGQLVLLSHHPEIFNQWAVGHGLVTERDGCGPVRIRKFAPPPGIDLTPAETIARGWSNQIGSDAAGIAQE
jgi:predicted ATPase